MTALLAKRAIKRTAGVASVMLHRAARPAAQPSACVLVYHRVSPIAVTERRLDDWNVPPSSLEQQIAWLAISTELLFVRDLPDRLAARTPSSKPLVCLTFDDGFQNFHDQVLPLLRRYRAKATLFVVSAYVGSPAPMPFDRWGLRHAGDTPAVAWAPIDWPSLERVAASGLVEIGGHSHHHYNAAVTCSEAIVQEAGQCRQVLATRLGNGHAVSYAYPYGSTRLGQVTDRYVASVRQAGFSTAVTTDLGLAHASSNRYALPRVEVYRSDTPAVVQAKVGGTLAPFFITDKLRRAAR